MNSPDPKAASPAPQMPARVKMRLAGRKRLDIVLGREAAVALQVLMRHYKKSTPRRMIELLLLDAQRRVLNAGAAESLGGQQHEDGT